MKIWNKTFLLAASALMLAGCGEQKGYTDQEVLDAVAKTSAIAVDNNGKSLDIGPARPNLLGQGSYLYLATSYIIVDKANVEYTVSIEWTTEFTSDWKITKFDSGHVKATPTFPAKGEEAKETSFTATFKYNEATSSTTLLVTLQPKTR